jgi:hypothetical protein
MHLAVKRNPRRGSGLRATASRIAAAAALLALAACGSNDSTPHPLTLSGSVSGLSATGLVLANGSETVSVSSGATSFTFGAVIYEGNSYAVTVQTQPAGETCSVANGGGIVRTANVANVVVTCAERAFSLGGSVDGLTNSGLVLANGSDTVAVAANATTFTFPSLVAAGSSYAVTVRTQPTGLACSVAKGTGTMPASAVATVAVTCTDQPFTLGGTISGLTTSGLVLANGSDTLMVSAHAATFTMPTAVDFGSSYALSVYTQPTGLTCSFSSGGHVAPSSGTMPANNVTTVALVCSPQSYALGGTVSGLTSGTLTLVNGSDTVNVTANGAFQLPTAVAYGSTYALTVQTQPAGQTCTVSNGTGLMPASAVTNVTVTCAAAAYTIGGSISGLTATGLVLQNNGADDTTISANATQFSMNTAVANASTYDITVFTQPTAQACQVANGSGTVALADVTSVQVSCQNELTYTTPGSYTWTVPSGVTNITVVAIGGGGGGGAGGAPGGAGGSGAEVTSVLAVQPGDTVAIYVGAGGASSIEGGGGGGLTYVGDGSSNFIIAGGGGGGGGGPIEDGAGGNAGSPGVAGGGGGSGGNGGGGGGGAGNNGNGGAAGSNGGGPSSPYGDTAGSSFTDILTSGSGSGGLGGGFEMGSTGGTGISSTVGNGGNGGFEFGAGGGGGGYGGGGGGGWGENGLGSGGGGGGGSTGPGGTTTVSIAPAGGPGAGGAAFTAGSGGSVVITFP